MGTRDTPATYSVAEARAIHREAARHEPLICPRCGHTLELGPTMIREGRPMAEACCPGCHRCIMVRRGDVDPGHRLPAGDS